MYRTPKMSYGDFFIRYEHKFLRNINSDSEIAESPQICALQNYYVVQQKFIKICISLLAMLDGSHATKYEHQFDIDLKYILLEEYLETDLEKLRSKIDSVQIKNVKTTNGKKIPRFNLKLYAFVYD